MKITVKINGRKFAVEVGDLHARPVVAMVDGERFEVWPEGEPVSELAPKSQVSPPNFDSGSLPAANGDLRVVRAPIPGVIISIAIQPGESVHSGQELCVLEAMKMKNTIRATRDGKIAVVKIASGQHVQHGDELVTFTE